MKRLQWLGVGLSVTILSLGAWWYMNPSSSKCCSEAAKVCTPTGTSQSSCTASEHTATASLPAACEATNASKVEKPEVACKSAQENSVEKENLDSWFAKNKAKASKERRFWEAMQGEIRKTQDPATNTVPRERLQSAIQFARHRQQVLESEGYYDQRGNIQAPRFNERGPDNIGGRTMAIMVDLNDPTGNTVYVGASGGGVWRTSDMTSQFPTWERVNDFWESLAIGGMAQDPTEKNYMYIATGDFFDSRGMGVYRSSDGGATFELLPSTSGSGDFFRAQGAAVDPTNGNVYVASQTGLMRSTNKGDTWQKVAFGEFWDVEVTSTGMVYAGKQGGMIRSSTGASGSWESLNPKPGYPTQLGRTEFNICRGNEDIIYVVGSDGGVGSRVYRSADGGENWVQKGLAAYPDGETFARGQVWYDLDITCNPANPDHVFIGGIDLWRSNNGGGVWDRISNWAGGPPQYVHADQHYMIFCPINANVAYFGNDGGIYRGNNMSSSNAISDKNLNYRTSLFYNIAMHPDTLAGFFLTGAQDNGSNRIIGDDVGTSVEVMGGDGFSCFIDQDQPQYQIASLYYGSFAVSSDGGYSFSGGVETNGSFYSISGYDSKNNNLYAETYDGGVDYYCYNVTNGNTETINAAGVSVNGNASHFKACPIVNNRIYVGTYNGQIFRIDNANTDQASGTDISGSVSGVISSVDVDPNNQDHLLVTVSNYGVNSVWETTNGGANWINLDGGASLPDMPVRWGMFNPWNTDQALIATELGVWSTDNINGAATEWFPPLPEKGIPMVRTDMLVHRTSDKMVAAATFGRGVWTTDVFSDPRAIAKFDQIQYINAGEKFSSSPSLGLETASWNFGDGNTSTEENPTHSYASVGSYPVQLTINGNLSTPTQLVKVLPDLPVPYTPDGGNWGGDFEGFDEQAGVHTDKGSSWVKGVSGVPKKAGTKSGNNCYVIAPTETYYAPNTHTSLYLPNFNLSEPGIYELSFWGKWDVQPGPDGMIVEYSLDRGRNWSLLGEKSDEWYNFVSVSNGNAFPEGTPFFTNNTNNQWKFFRTSISNLAGNPDVAIRFRFKADATGNFAGVAVDDVQIKSYNGELKTQVIDFTGQYIQPTKIQLDWTTLPEYYCKRFFVEFSENGIDYERPVDQPIIGLPSTGGTTIDEQYYTYIFNGLKELYYFRIFVENENTDGTYSYDFYAGPIAVRLNEDEPIKPSNIFPNPFVDQINVLFNGFVNTSIKFELFDELGRKLHEETQQVNGVMATFKTGDLPEAHYYLRITQGDNQPETFKVVKANP